MYTPRLRDQIGSRAPALGAPHPILTSDALLGVPQFSTAPPPAAISDRRLHVHRPGEAQVDVGQALIKQDGILRKVVFFVFVLPYSDALFVQVFERSCLETWAEARNRAFAFFGLLAVWYG